MTEAASAQGRNKAWNDKANTMEVDAGDPRHPHLGDGSIGEYFKNFIGNFERAVDEDAAFSKMMEDLMAGMLTKDLLCEPVFQIAGELERYMQRLDKGEVSPVPKREDRERYEKQLSIYKRIVEVYGPTGAKPSDPTVEDKKEIHALLMELQEYGGPPPEVMSSIGPPEMMAETKKGNERGMGLDADGSSRSDDHFDEFIKAMGLDADLDKAESHMLSHLSENPEELHKVFAEMNSELVGLTGPGGQKEREEACKQQ